MAGDLFEQAGKVLRRRKPELIRNKGDRFIFGQHLLGASNALRDQERMRRRSREALEARKKAVRRESGLFGKVIERI